jgi:hypothetical protein
MGFKALHPQSWEHSDGYRVHFADAYAIEYIEQPGPRHAAVEATLASMTRVRVFEKRLQGWFIGAGATEMTDADRRLVLDRIAAAFEFGGFAVSREDA